MQGGTLVEYIVGIAIAALALLVIPAPFGLILVLGLLIGAVMRLSDSGRARSPAHSDMAVPASAREQVRAQMARYEQEWRERQEDQ